MSSIKVYRRKKQDRKKAEILPGMKDIGIGKDKYWEYFFEKSKKLARNFGFGRMKTPILEERWLFEKGTGQKTELYDKKMYDFLDSRSGKKIALRPEITPSIVRSYIEQEMYKLIQPVKLYYLGPIFRYEEKVGHHQINQFGLEIIGSEKAISESELILYADCLFKDLGLKIDFKLNSLGCNRCRFFYLKKLTNFLKKNRKNFCPECRKHFDSNPLRVFHCLNERCREVLKNAPQMINSLCAKCQAHFTKFLEFLDIMEIPYQLDPYLIGQTSYYSGPVYAIFISEEQKKINERLAQAAEKAAALLIAETLSNKPEEQNEIKQPLPETKKKQPDDVCLGVGGRYDHLVENLGGPSTPACGLAFNINQIVAESIKAKIRVNAHRKNSIFLARAGELAIAEALRVKKFLIEAGYQVFDALEQESLTAQLALASKFTARFILLMGQQEVKDQTIIFRDLELNSQETLNREKLIDELKKRLK